MNKYINILIVFLLLLVGYIFGTLIAMKIDQIPATYIQVDHVLQWSNEYPEVKKIVRQEGFLDDNILTLGEYRKIRDFRNALQIRNLK